MSASYYLETTVDGHTVELDDFNYTYNCGPMLRAAGPWSWQDFIGPAHEVAAKLGPVIVELTRQPDVYKAYNPANGWGDYDTFVDFLDRFIKACCRYRSANVRGWF